MDTSVDSTASDAATRSPVDAMYDRVFEPAAQAAEAWLRDRTVKPANLLTLTQSMHGVIEALGILAAGIVAELDVLRARIEAAEQKGFPYAGVWRQGQVYAEGTLVTYDGSIWYARSETTDRPGDGRTAWVLAVKRGKDGKDLRP